MSITTDRVALDDWYAVESIATLGTAPRRQRLLGQDIVVWRDEAGQAHARADRHDLPVIERYGCIFTTLGTPTRDLVQIAEAAEDDRLVVVCGWVTIHCSGPRIVENFLDMAHFPYVHTNILGAEPRTEVPPYRTELRDGEMWALNCRFWQPLAAATESNGMMMDIDYRVPSPYIVMLYRVAPTQPERRDCIALFIQPIEEDLCRAQPVMWLADGVSTHTDALHFEQTIFLQDRLILEGQRPRTMPLDPRAEIPMRADAASMAYRRYVAERGLRFGIHGGAA